MIGNTMGDDRNLKIHSKRKNVDSNTYLLLMFIAIELFMSFSFVGYIHIEPISLTFVYIPVLISGCILGPKESTIVGAVFGLASMWKASAFYVGVGGAIFSPSMSGKPLESIVLSIGSRALFGLVTGLLFSLAKKIPCPRIGIAVVASFGRILHAFIVYTCMMTLFPEAGFTVRDTLTDIQQNDFVPFTIITVVAVIVCYEFYRSPFFQKFMQRIHKVNQASAKIASGKWGVIATVILVTLASVSVAVYFTNRIETVMSQYNIRLSDDISYDLMHLQIQFLLGILSLAMIVIIVIILHQKNYSYLSYEARLDGLTGLLRRRYFFHIGEKLVKSSTGGYFIIMDIDRFKMINDTYGHPVGDQVLAKVADYFQEAFSRQNIFGRLGGDEFVALIISPLSKADIENTLNDMKDRLKKLQIQDLTVTCSIGVIPVDKNYSLEELYRQADHLLYEAKKNGKDQFVFGK